MDPYRLGPSYSCITNQSRRGVQASIGGGLESLIKWKLFGKSSVHCADQMAAGYVQSLAPIEKRL